MSRSSLETFTVGDLRTRARRGEWKRPVLAKLDAKSETAAMKNGNPNESSGMSGPAS